MLAQSPEPEAHNKVLENNADRIGIWKCWFLRRRENLSIRRKTSRSKEENQQQTQPTYDAGSGNRTQDTLFGGECSCSPATMVTMENIGLISVSLKDHFSINLAYLGIF